MAALRPGRCLRCPVLPASRVATHNLSFLSTALFFVGSALFVVVDAVDLHRVVAIDIDPYLEVSGYVGACYVAAAASYLLNAVVDLTIAYARGASAEAKAKAGVLSSTADTPNVAVDDDDDDDDNGRRQDGVEGCEAEEGPVVARDRDDIGCGGGRLASAGDGTTNADGHPNSDADTGPDPDLDLDPSLLLREISLEKYVAFLFGVGGALDLSGAVTYAADVKYPSTISDVLALSAMHLYLLEAVFSVLGRRLILRRLILPAVVLRSPPAATEDCDAVSDKGGWCTAARRFTASRRLLPITLDGTGDALFLVGYVIDLATSYVALDEVDEGIGGGGNVQLHSWALASSILWLIDSVLYIVLAARSTDGRRRYSNGCRGCRGCGCGRW